MNLESLVSLKNASALLDFVCSIFYQHVHFRDTTQIFRCLWIFFKKNHSNTKCAGADALIKKTRIKYASFFFKIISLSIYSFITTWDIKSTGHYWLHT